MAQREEGQNLEKIFTLAEANQLIPQLTQHLTRVKQARITLVRIKDDIKKASAKATFGGGSPAGVLYIKSLEQIGEHLQAIQEMGIHVKDLDMGLCDFPSLLDGRVVFLCWKLGETEIRWWHELNTGYVGRKPLEVE